MANLVLLASLIVLAACSSTAWAQSAVTTPKIGYLSAAKRSSGGQFDSIREKLREAGYVEGKNVLIEPRFADQRLERVPVSFQLPRGNAFGSPESDDTIFPDMSYPADVAANDRFLTFSNTTVPGREPPSLQGRYRQFRTSNFLRSGHSLVLKPTLKAQGAGSSVAAEIEAGFLASTAALA